MSHHRIVKIFAADAGLASTLSAAVSTVRGCVAQTSTNWPPVEPLSDSADPSSQDHVFEIVAHVDLDSQVDVQCVLKWLSRLRSGNPFPKIILVTDHARGDRESMQLQQKFLHCNISEIMERPLNLQRFRYLLDSRAIEYDFWLKKRARSEHHGDRFCEVQKRMSKVAAVDTNVLMTGETGVGKTYWAEWIHRQSHRAGKPFVVVNCGNFSPTLVESQLFGHARGAFTGADRKQAGQFEFAGQGTIFLDEIDALPLEIQAKLLRVVENREYRPLGENKALPMKARIISATNRDLEELVAKEQFRADLVYRLNAYEIQIPSLRERTSQIEKFCRYFAKRFARNNKRKPVTFEPAVIEVLTGYEWPGNLRELRNCVEYAAIDSEDQMVHLQNLPPKIRQSANTSGNPDSARGGLGAVDISGDSTFDVAAYHEVRRLITALEKHNYNRSETARELGVSRMTVYNMLKRHDLG